MSREEGADKERQSERTPYECGGRRNGARAAVRGWLKGKLGQNAGQSEDLWRSPHPNTGKQALKLGATILMTQ